MDKNIIFNEKITNIEIYVILFLRLIIDGSKLSVILMFGIGFLNHKIGFGEFVSLMSIVYILEKILNSFADIYKEFNQNFVEVEKLWDFFDTTPEIEGYETGKEFEYKTGAIELKNINFGYSENKKVFKNFNLNLAGGKITAFVGNSGGGKTTLVKIISQYIKQDSGKVLIDGQYLEEVSLKSYYKNIGYLTQEPSVFDGSIYDNLTYALENNVEQPQNMIGQPQGIAPTGETNVGVDLGVYPKNKFTR